MLLKKRLTLMNNFFENFKYYFLLIAAIAIYSITSIFSKLSSQYTFLSKEYIVFFLLIILFLGFYAILWQQILKHIDLSVAISFKPIVLVFNTIWAYLFFFEKVLIKNIIGLCIILIGVSIIALHNE